MTVKRESSFEAVFPPLRLFFISCRCSFVSANMKVSKLCNCIRLYPILPKKLLTAQNWIGKLIFQECKRPAAKDRNGHICLAAIRRMPTRRRSKIKALWPRKRARISALLPLIMICFRRISHLKPFPGLFAKWRVKMEARRRLLAAYLPCVMG